MNLEKPLKYIWKAKTRASVPAQVVGTELARISEARLGRMQPVDVVEASQDTDAPLHQCFEWNNRKAADAHRITQAQYLIRHVVAVYQDSENGEPQTIRAFVSIALDNEERHYEPIAAILSDADKRARLLAIAENEVVAWHDRYQNFVEFAAIHAAIDKTVGKKKKARKREATGARA